jgi:hypothetical protein
MQSSEHCQESWRDDKNFRRNSSASNRTAAKLRAASPMAANRCHPVVLSMPDAATVTAATAAARPNLASVLMGQRIDGPPVQVGPICHKAFGLLLNPLRHFEEMLNRFFKK